MNFLRKYSAFLIPAAVVVVAVILFVPTILIGRSVKKDMEESISSGNQIKSLVRKTPSKNQYKEEKLYQDQHAKEAKEVEKSARYSSRRGLISYDIFPEPRDTSQQIFIGFGRKFREAIDGPGGLIKRMNALDAPSEINIIKETERKGGTLKKQRKRSTSQRKKKKGAGGAMRDAVCRRRAEEISVYANPKIFKWYDFWEDYEFIGSETALQDCWYTQNSYWVYEDVVETIRMMNAGSDCVFTSPVKRLVGISFTGPIPELSERSRSSTSSGFVDDIPGYVLVLEDEPIGVQTWTGRKGNNKIDIIHFYLSVIIDSKTLMPFMRELCSEKEHDYREGYQEDGAVSTYKHNQITILKSQIRSVVKTSDAHSNYKYGSDAVIRLDLACEYIFNRSGYDQIKPKPIKELLGQWKGTTSSKTASSIKKTSGSKKTSRSRRSLEIDE
jgi:hypothetical protein